MNKESLISQLSSSIREMYAEADLSPEGLTVPTVNSFVEVHFPQHKKGQSKRITEIRLFKVTWRATSQTSIVNAYRSALYMETALGLSKFISEKDPIRAIIESFVDTLKELPFIQNGLVTVGSSLHPQEIVLHTQVGEQEVLVGYVKFPMFRQAGADPSAPILFYWGYEHRVTHRKDMIDIHKPRGRALIRPSDIRQDKAFHMAGDTCAVKTVCLERYLPIAISHGFRNFREEVLHCKVTVEADAKISEAVSNLLPKPASIHAIVGDKNE